MADSLNPGSMTDLAEGNILFGSMTGSSPSCGGTAMKIIGLFQAREIGFFIRGMIRVNCFRMRKCSQMTRFLILMTICIKKRTGCNPMELDIMFSSLPIRQMFMVNITNPAFIKEPELIGWKY